MGEYINIRTTIDSETGEVLKESNWIGYDGFTDKGYRYRARQPQIHFNLDSIPDNLSKDSMVLLFMLAELMNQDNVLVYRVERKSKFSNFVYKPYDKEDLRLRCRFRFGMNKFDKCWQELSRHCLKRVQYYQYIVWAINPAVIHRSNFLPIWLCAEFKEYLLPHLSPSTVKKLQNKIDNLE